MVTASVDHCREMAVRKAELARRLGVCQKTIDNWRKRGLPCHKIAGGTVVFFPNEVTEWIRGKGGQKQ